MEEELMDEEIIENKDEQEDYKKGNEIDKI